MSDPVDLEPGRLVRIGGKLMGICGRCGKLVRWKRLVGTNHVCRR